VSYVDCKVVVSWLKHLFQSIDEDVELRVWIDVEEVPGRQLRRHVKDRLDVIHYEAVVKRREERVCRDVTNTLSATQVRCATYHQRVIGHHTQL